MIEHAVAELIRSPRLPDHIRQLQNYLAEEQERRKAFHANLPDDARVEFINGEIVKAIPTRKVHNDVIRLLLRLLDEHVESRGLGYVGFQELMISLDRNDYEPDICFWAKQKAKTFSDRQTKFPPPDFVVEVLSDTTEDRDRTIKFDDYASNGITEYWIIDAEAEIVEQYVLTEGRYKPLGRLRGGLISCKAVIGFEIPVRAIFDTTENRAALRKIING
jgi:Uma2 family endonuclease